jgi:hypothetical protein
MTEMEKLEFRITCLERWSLFLDRMLLCFLILATLQTVALISLLW